MKVRPVSVALKPETIKAVDEAAKSEGRTRSQYIQRLLEQHLQPARQEARREEIPLKFG